MLKLRPFKNCDAKKIVTWCKDEKSFRQWCSDRFETFPISAEDIIKKYVENNGDCSEEDNFFPMTAFSEEGIVGHLIMRYTNQEKSTLRFGFIIVDSSMRGKGYGKEMLKLALDYAFNILKVEKVTLGVFDNNPSAYHCYKSVGFKEVALEQPIIVKILDEEWNIVELEMIREEKQCEKIEKLR